MTAPAKRPSCGACLFWELTKADDRDVAPCYRFPPAPTDRDPPPRSRRPLLHARDRACGEFKPRSAEENRT